MQDSAKLLLGILASVLQEADAASLASLKCAVERMTSSAILMSDDPSLADGQALVVDSKSGKVHEIHVNFGFLRSRKTVQVLAHELFHILANHPACPFSGVINLVSGQSTEEDLAVAFGALIELVRPSVAARKKKTDAEAKSLSADIRKCNEKASSIVDIAVGIKGESILFVPPLVCGNQEDVSRCPEGCRLASDFYHKKFHNIRLRRSAPSCRDVRFARCRHISLRILNVNMETERWPEKSKVKLKKDLLPGKLKKPRTDAGRWSSMMS